MNKALYTRWVAPLLAEAEQVADTLKEFGVEYVGAVKLSWIGPTPPSGDPGQYDRRSQGP